jgi:aerobic carbon-monoxide dehydrogenase medium subunit
MLRPFRVLRPATVGEASQALRRFGEAAKVYAGGSELLLLLRNRLVEYDYLVDVKHIPDLQHLDWSGAALHVGASITHRQLEQSPVVAEHLPILAEVEAQVANVRVRNVGSLGGNLCFNDPHSDPGTVLLVHDAIVALQRGRAKRRLPLEDFWLGSYETVLEPDELLVSIDVPALPAGAGAAYERVERFERPSVGVAVAAGLVDGRLSDVRLAVGCVGPKPTRLRDLEARVAGLRLEEAQTAVRSARGEIEHLLEPVEDIHGSVEYKSYIVPVLLVRTLSRAVERAGVNGGRSDR